MAEQDEQLIAQMAAQQLGAPAPEAAPQQPPPTLQNKKHPD